MSFFTTRPYLLAIAIVAGVFAWMYAPAKTDNLDTDAVEPPTALQKVAIRQIQAQPMTRNLRFSGSTEPARTTSVSAEVSGRVVAVGVNRGEQVAAGDLILRLSKGDISPDLTSARAEMRSARKEYNAQRKLADRGLVARNVADRAQASYEATRARVSKFERSLGNTTVNAPFSGLLAERLVEIGDYVNVGHAVAELLLLDEMIVVGDIPEKDVINLQIGQTGQVQLVDGTQVTGQIRYISPRANAKTRTFRVELEFPNDEGRVRAGMTSEVKVDYAEVLAHKLSPALLSLDSQGYLGVRALDDEHIVHFHRAKLLESDAEGVWLGDLPEQLTLITRGQGFVREGQKVEPVTSSNQ